MSKEKRVILLADNESEGKTRKKGDKLDDWKEKVGTVVKWRERERERDNFVIRLFDYFLL